ncbi:peptidoglycan DD-metalloendopeptidase family protein [Alkalihalobacillus oceani]|uniref:Peptidoglycan DD-metalloendopeptidase family protein n=1 Tax=Halalkalibacter oceani TaxID=1653776 RepID=A0A9X2IRV4_9BACI|nr:peptidoglycan DD-metalloendopeptidase family protein [Halalkalibacter oceani]MCM3715958.1 peptidoglycan DD-metalloendopeptidase family protein [Halalkalibacter oceani]
MSSTNIGSLNRRKKVLIGLMLLMMIVAAQIVKADGKLIYTIYHVYVDGNHVGYLLDEEKYNSLVENMVETYQEQYPDYSLQIAEQVEIIPEFVFHQKSMDEQTLSALKEKLSVEAEAVAIYVNEEAAVYLPTEEEADKTLESFITQFVDEQEYETYLEIEEAAKASETEETTVSAAEVGETELVDVELSEDVVQVAQKTSPENVLTVKEAVKKLTKGVLEEQPYEVKEGDVLGSIANEHDLTTAELLDLNEGLTEETVLQIGQELKVTAYEPYMEVISTMKKSVEEEIPFQIEVKEDESMWKGDQKVTQPGQNGLQLVDYQLTERNGQLVKKEAVQEEIIQEPVTKVVVRGTKEMPSRGTGELSWPAVGGYISSYQGNRWGRFHRGIDIARPSNYDILAADNGTVTFAGQQGGYGNVVKINHNNGMETLYAHLRSIDVQVGQTVAQGQKIGVMGTTGNSTGIHLHFEVTENGQLKNPMDYLNR